MTEGQAWDFGPNIWSKWLRSRLRTKGLAWLDDLELVFEQFWVHFEGTSGGTLMNHDLNMASPM